MSKPDTAQAEATEGHDFGELKKRARRGMLALGLRSVLQHLIVLVANVYLARTLSPSDYGVFAIVQFALSLFTLLGDAGLAVALIQQRDKPTQQELSSIWWFQLGFATSIVALVFVSAPWVIRIWPELPSDSLWLLRGLSLGFFFTILRSIPMMLLERDLRFGWISTLEFAGTIAFYGSAVALASHGAGVASLVTATVVQSVSIAVAVNLARRWVPSWHFDWPRTKELLRFGLAFRGRDIVGFVNSAVTPLLAGIRLGQAGLGIVQFAQNTAWFPTNVLGIVRRVFFPYLSRLQHDQDQFAKEFDRAIALAGLPVFFFMGLCLGIGPSLVSVIYSDKWLPAVPALYVFSVALTINFFGWIGSAALEAIGRPGIFFKITVLAALVNWPATMLALAVDASPLAFACGFSVHVLFTNTVMYRILRRLVPKARPLKGLWSQALAGLLTAAVGRWALGWTYSVPGLALWVVVAVVLFTAVAMSLDPALRRSAVLFWQRRRVRSEPK